MNGVVIRYPQRTNRKVYVGIGIAFVVLGVVCIGGGLALVPAIVSASSSGAVTVGLVITGIVWMIIGVVTIVVNFASGAARLAGQPWFGADQRGVVLGPSFTLPWSEVAELRSTWESAEPSDPSMALAGGGHIANAMISSAVGGQRTLVVTVRVRDWQAAKGRAAAAGKAAAGFFSDETAPAIVLRFHPLLWGQEVGALDEYLRKCGALR